MKDQAPSFIQHIFVQRLHGQGLSRHDLAVFAATMTDLIHSEVSGNLQRVYAALEFPTVGPVTNKEFDSDIRAYLLAYLSGGGVVVSKMEGFVLWSNHGARITMLGTTLSCGLQI